MKNTCIFHRHLFEMCQAKSCEQESIMTGRGLDKVTKFIVFVCFFNLFLLYLLYNHSEKLLPRETAIEEEEEEWENPTSIKFIYFLDYKESSGMSKFAECQDESQHCIITGDEHFLRHNGLSLFDAVIIHVEGYKEDQVPDSSTIISNDK